MVPFCHNIGALDNLCMFLNSFSHLPMLEKITEKMFSITSTHNKVDGPEFVPINENKLRCFCQPLKRNIMSGLINI
ncbi:hypothetical protein RRG08_062148 [Elysia crispata]|uniref:Uncharacterized protein n=1 Tax=Elysia crispata TaxID=231223 RepID=A0AAE0YNZ4_9GAST|nr:hypothetical protein RRG08_062148 [Elysia crispata]